MFPILLYEEKIRSTGVSERAIAAYVRDGISFSEKRMSQRAFTAEKKKKEKKNGPRIVKAALKSIYCGSFY